MKFYWKIPIIFFIYFITSFLISLLGAIVFGIDTGEFANPQHKPSITQLVMLNFIMALSGLITLLFYTKGLENKPFPILYFSIKNIKRDLGLALITTTTIIIVGTVALIVSNQIRISFGAISLAEFSSATLLFIAVAFSEEILSRGIIQKVLMDAINPYFALLIGAIIFAFMHSWNDNLTWIGMTNLVLAGIFLGVVFLYTENLWFAIVAHFLWNFLQSPIIGFNVSGMDLPALFEITHLGNSNITGGEFGFEGSLICSVLLSIGICFTEKRYRTLHPNSIN